MRGASPCDAPRMDLVVRGLSFARSAPRCSLATMTLSHYHQCMTPRVRSTRGVINHSLGPGPWALSPSIANGLS